MEGWWGAPSSSSSQVWGPARTWPGGTFHPTSANPPHPRLGIPLVSDLPVGQNMQSHVGTGEVSLLIVLKGFLYKETLVQVVFTLKEPVSFNPLRLFLNPVNILAYLGGRGPLAAVSG